MNWPLLISAFTFIFLAALPGRTTFFMLLMAARVKPWVVFRGAALAFAVQSVISVALGNLFSFLPARAIQLGVGLLFFYFAYHFWRDGRRVEAPDSRLPTNSVRSVFLLIFAAEWGDVSQVAIASFSARHPEKLITVFLSSVAALWLIAGLAIGVGTHVGRASNPALIQRLAAVGFAMTGIYLVMRALFVGMGGTHDSLSIF